MQAIVSAEKLNGIPSSAPAVSVTKMAFHASVYPASKTGVPVSMTRNDVGI